MKKLILILLTTLILWCGTTTCFAYIEEGPADPPPSSGGTTIGPSDNVPEPDPPPPYTTYIPKITQLRNINARTVMNEEANVYYIPTLDDLPFSLKDYVSDIKVGKDSHRFALVYDGYYDTEALATTADTKKTNEYAALAHTSQKVYSAYTNTLALSTIGYDLLLEDEEYHMRKEGKGIDVTYHPTTVFEADSNTNGIRKYKDLKYQTVVMDIYKALGVYEFDVTFEFGEDPYFDANSSPILEQLSVLTGYNETDGMDISESNTYVAVTRTNPKRYWDRYIKERVADGDTSDEDIAVSIHTSVCKSPTSTLTLGEFCSVARALMNLYGEPVLTAEERKLCEQLYNIYYPQGTLSKEVHDSVLYLAAKGIIEPEGLDLNKTVTYEDIDLALGRIANESARLTLKTPEYTNVYLQERGYSQTTLKFMEGVEDYTEEDYDTATWYDFYIQREYRTTYFAEPLQKKEDTAETEEENDDINVTVPTVTVKPTDLIMETSSGLRLVSEAGGTINPNDDVYVFKGVVNYNGYQYYHYKIRKKYCNGSTISFAYDYTAEDLQKADNVANGDDVITLPNADGGIYSYYVKNKNGKYPEKVYGAAISWKHTTFTEANFDRTFVDKQRNRKVNAPLANKRRLITFYKDSNLVTKSILEAYDVDGYSWSKLLANGADNTACVTVHQSDPLVHCTIHPPIAAGSNKVRFEIIVDDVDKFKQSAFYQQYIPGDTDGFETGYYRAEDNSLLVSSKYLKDLGILTAITPLEDDAGYILTSSEYGTNITINTKHNYVLVGDTMYAKIENETLAYKTDGDIYISYRACLGWASNYVVVPDGSGEAVFACNYYVTNNDRSVINNSTKKIQTLFPTSHTSLLYTDFTYGRNVQHDVGFSMAGSYALAPYIIVMDSEGTKDGLFVYHLKEAKTSDGTKVTVPDDTAARDKFKNMTGVSLPASEEYALCYYKLNRTNDSLRNNSLKYVSLAANRANTESQDIFLGYVLNPKQYNVNNGGLVKAADAYVKAANENRSRVALPIVAIKSGTTITYYDVNLNYCKENTGAEVLPVGTLPASMHSRTSRMNNKLVKLLDNGTTEILENPSTSTAVKEYKIVPAPAGIFSSLKLLGKGTYDNVSESALYYGTSVCNIKNGKVFLNNHSTTLSADTDVVCSYKGMTDANSVFISTSVETSLGEMMKELNDELEALINDPSNLVDWGQYKFERLVKNLDAWSTVVLIFVLNIMPRVAMLVFMVLILLSLIHDVKPWRMFCERVFDVYKFLTFGHITVDIVDMKRLVFTSLICLALFMMIMDGQLFNFIIWIAKFFIALYQH